MGKDREVISRIIRLKLVDGTMVNGQVNIEKGEAGFERLSDLIKSRNEDFITIVKATCYQKDKGLEEPVKSEVIILNKRHILWASPEVDQI